MNIVLLIDDEPKMGDLVAMTLEDFDVKVIQVTSLAEARSKLQARRLPFSFFLTSHLATKRTGLPSFLI